VPTPGRLEPLADAQPLTLILRLVIASGGRLVHGEIVDVEGVVHIRFAHWQELVPSLEQVIARMRPETSANG
jgi:hypothetical protein